MGDSHLDYDIAAKAAAQSLNRKNYDVVLRTGMGTDPVVVFHPTSKLEYDLIYKQLSSMDIPKPPTKKESLDISPVEVVGIENLHRMASFGFDTGVNDELFPDLKKSAISPSRV